MTKRSDFISLRRELTREESRKVAAEILYLTTEADINEGEFDLVTSIEMQFHRDGRLSDKQLEKISEIYRRHI